MGSLHAEVTVLPRGDGAAIVLDDDQVGVVGEGAKRFPVAATINGHHWRSTVTRMRGEYLLGLSREVRTAAGIETGDRVELAIELDTEPRLVEVPPALARALAGDPIAAEAYEALPFTHRKEYARWIDEAKRDETRERRIGRALEMLHAGERLS